MPKLLMLPPAPVIRLGPDRVRLDTKYVEGMAYICANWPGKVDCVLRTGAGAIPFGAEYQIADLPFGLTVLDAEEAVPVGLLGGYDIIEASGDMHLDLDLDQQTGQGRAKHAFVIEYTLAARLKILGLERDRSPFQKAKTALWLLRQEQRRRRAMRQADGVQMNGFPAFDSYQRLNGNALMYLDNRMRDTMFASPDEMAARSERLRDGGALRLINSGRLEPMKGAQDLIPVARALAEKGVNFTLDIYGTGSLEADIQRAISDHGLDSWVRLHAPVDFETELVPISRREADLFLSCHRQSDPSCTYLEAMGCGLPVAGYANEMLARLVNVSKAGWTVRPGDTAALATMIAGIAAEPARLRETGDAALSFARKHDFATEFARRRQHLLALVDAA